MNFSRNSKVGLFSGLINFVVWQQDQETKFVLSLCSATLSVAAFPLRLTLFIGTVWLPHPRGHIKNSSETDRKGTFLMFLSHKLQSLSAAAAAKSHQSCPTLFDPIDGSPAGSPVPGILQARILEWVAISSSNAWKWKVNVTALRCVRLLATPWTAAYQAPPSMGFSRQEYWSGVPLPSPVFKANIALLTQFPSQIYLFLNKILARELRSAWLF